MSLVENWKRERAYKKAAESKINKIKTAAYYKAREKESIIEAQEKAKAEREQKVKSYKTGNTGGFKGVIQNIGKSLSEQPKTRSSSKGVAPRYTGPSGLDIMMGTGFTTGSPKITRKRTTKRTTKRKTKKRSSKKKGKKRVVLYV